MYESEFMMLLRDENSTPEEIRKMRDRWSHYYAKPMPGSKRDREFNHNDYR